MLISRLRTNTSEFACLIRASNLDVNAGAITAQAYSFFLNNPSYYRNPAGTIGQMADVSALLANEQKMFDEYKVTKLTIKYLPFVNAQVRVNTAVAYTAATDPLLVMGPDLDDSALWTSTAKALNSQNPAIYSAYSPRMSTITMRQQDPVDKMKWLNLGAIVPSLTAPPDPNNPAKLFTIKVWKQAYQVVNLAEGRFIAEWTMLLRGSYTLA